MEKLDKMHFIIVINLKGEKVLEVWCACHKSRLSKKKLNEKIHKIMVKYDDLSKKFPSPYHDVILGIAKDLHAIKLSFPGNWDNIRLIRM